MSEHEHREGGGLEEPESYRSSSEVGTEDAPGGSAGVAEPATGPAAGGQPMAPLGEGPAPASSGHATAPNMLPGRARRGTGLERFVVRVVATGGVVGIGVAIGAILAANTVQGWIIGLVVSAVSVVLSAILWSSRQL